MYQAIKHIHMATVAISLAGFVLRWIWVLRGSPWARQRLTRILPHINDTILLVSGVALVWMSHQYPWVYPWLGVKLTALLFYIYWGGKAIKSSGDRRRGIVNGLLAVLTFGYMLLVAISRSPWPF